MRRSALIVLAACAAVAAAGSTGAQAADDPLAKLLAGRMAGTPRRCIMPDLSAMPRIMPGGRIVYYRGSTTYVGRLRDGCPALRQGRRIITTSIGNQLCRNDPVRIVDANGGSGFGFCTFEDFVPYRKAK